MEKAALKEFIYGGMLELMRNRKYYYHSPVGVDYCHWTEEGVKALAEYTNFVGAIMIKSEEADLNARAQNLVLAELKK